MAEPYIAEIRMNAFNFAPSGWAMCNGQLLPIAQNSALFSILGTTFGGNGVQTFALPDLRGRAPIHWGSGPQGNVNLGQSGGEENHTLTTAEMASHTHQAQANSGGANVPTPVNNVWCAESQSAYTPNGPDGVMNPTSIGNNGGSQPHSNLEPYLVVTFCIALQGIFPSRN
ncbi:MAG: tail fiber protein [Betaproteobacteria bacterium]